MFIYRHGQYDNDLLSTDNFLFQIENPGSQIRNDKIDQNNLTIGGLDVENLYGRIDTKLASQIVREKVLESPLNFENIESNRSNLIFWHILKSKAENM